MSVTDGKYRAKYNHRYSVALAEYCLGCSTLRRIPFGEWGSWVQGTGRIIGAPSAVIGRFRQIVGLAKANVHHFEMAMCS